MNKISFFNKENLELEISEGFKVIDTNESILNKLLRQEELEGHLFKVDEEEPKEITQLFHLKVNIKYVGSLSSFFVVDSFNKEELIQKIANLREIKVIDKATATEKVKSLFEILNEVSPLFSVYKSKKEKYSLTSEELCSLEHNFALLYHEHKEEEEIVVQKLPKIKKEKAPKVIKEKKEKVPFKELVKETFGKVKAVLTFFFEPFNKKKFYFLFIFVSSFLIEFTISVGLYHCYAGKMLLIFFFVVSLVGAVLNYFVIKDIKNIIMDYRIYSMVILTDLLGIGAGVGALAIFNVTQKEVPANLPPLGKLILFSVLISLGVLLLSTTVGIIIPWKKKKSDN